VLWDIFISYFNKEDNCGWEVFGNSVLRSIHEPKNEEAVGA
jgi:hypothetical protein